MLTSKLKDKSGVFVTYLGRSVPIEQFRTFVYDINKVPKLAESYREFADLLATGEWFATKDDVDIKNKKLEQNSAEKEKEPVTKQKSK